MLTVSTLLDNYYGISDVCLSIPAIVNRNGLSRILSIELNETERQQLQSSAEVLKQTIAVEYVTRRIIMTIHLGVQSLLSILAGILILIRPKLLNYVVAIYLIVVGVLGIFPQIRF